MPVFLFVLEYCIMAQARKSIMKVVPVEGGEPRIEQVEFNPHLGLYEESAEGGGRKPVKFRLGASLGGLDAVKDKARLEGRALYAALGEGGDLIELIPEVAPIGGLERSALHRIAGGTEWYERGLARDLGGLDAAILPPDKSVETLRDTMKTGDVSVFRERVESMAINEAQQLSWDIVRSTPLLNGGRSSGLVRSVGPFLSQLDGIVLGRLGGEFQSDVLQDPKVRGLVVRDGFEGLFDRYYGNKPGAPLNALDDIDAMCLKAIFGGGAASAVPEVEAVIRKLFAPNPDFAEDSPLNYESGVCRRNARQLATTYAAKWDKLADIAGGACGGKVGLRDASIAAFWFSKRYFVVRPFEPNVEGFGYRGYLATFDLNEKTRDAFAEVAEKLNEGLRRSEGTVGIVESLTAPMSNALEAVRGERDAEVRGRAKYIRFLFKSPAVFVDMARAWRPDY